MRSSGPISSSQHIFQDFVIQSALLPDNVMSSYTCSLILKGVSARVLPHRAIQQNFLKSASSTGILTS